MDLGLQSIDSIQTCKHNLELCQFNEEILADEAMILTGNQISERIGTDIRIDPFRPANVNPNSYNLTLHEDIMTYEEVVLDMGKENRVRHLKIPKSGLVLEPNRLYLARTVEHTETRNLVPMIEGRSSIGRLGLFVHVTAGFGDVGVRGFWTLEMFAVQPIRIYPGVQICQIFYHEVTGEIQEYCSDKYQDNSGIQPSKMYQELHREGIVDDRQMSLGFRR